MIDTFCLNPNALHVRRLADHFSHIDLNYPDIVETHDWKDSTDALLQSGTRLESL
jgi:hypothetical protein